MWALSPYPSRAGYRGYRNRIRPDFFERASEGGTFCGALECVHGRWVVDLHQPVRKEVLLQCLDCSMGLLCTLVVYGVHFSHGDRLSVGVCVATMFSRCVSCVSDVGKRPVSEAQSKTGNGGVVFCIPVCLELRRGISHS